MVRMEGEAVVRVNSEDAQSELKKLQGEASKLRKEIIEASKAEVMDPKKIEALKKKLSETTQEINASKKAAFDYKKVLDNLSGASLTELNKAAQKLNFETKNLARNTEEYAQKSKQLKLLQTEIGKVRKEMSGAGSDTRGFFTRMNDGFNNYGGSIIAFTAGLSGVVLGLRQASEAANAFEERVDNLQAITGLQGENLEYLKQASKDMSISMTEDGIRIKQSADEIVDAFTTMGSQIPALLKNKEALRGVTEDAMILANAGKTELAPAAQGLAMAMNQFNASADQSRRYINALAAGSLEGAGDIPYLSKVFETAGTEAYGLGLNIEQLTAITETIAPKFKEPSVAGTSLRNIFVSLSTGADKFNPKIVGLKTAFDNLADANLSNNDLLKMFGRDSKSAAKILIAQRAETERLTTAVTDTNVAIEQAKINTDNNAAALAQAKNKLHLFTIELGEKMSPALLVSTNLLKYLLQIILHVVNNFDTYKRILIIVTSSILTYTIATKGAALAQAAWSRIVAAGTAIQKLFNSTMKANPLGLFLTALVAVTTTLVLFADKMRGATMSQKVMNDLQTETNKRLAEEKINLDVLFTKLKDVNISTEERAKLIDQINTQYGKYLPSLLTEKSTAEDIDKAYKAINISMRKNIEIQARKEKLIEIEKELIDLNEEARKGTEKLVSDNFLDKLTRQNTLMGMTGVVKDIKELEKVRDELMKSAVDAEIETINTTATESEPENTGSGGGSGIDEKTKEEKEKAAKLLAEYEATLTKLEQNFKKSIEEGALRRDTVIEDPVLEEEVLDEGNQAQLDAITESYFQTLEGRRVLLKAHLDMNLISETDYKNKVIALDNEIRDAKIANAKAAFDSSADMLSSLSGLFGSFAKGQKAAILFQLAADQASAISSLMKMSEANPSNAVTFGGAATLQFISGMIRIGANFAKAYSALNKAKEPKTEATPRKGFFGGGFTGGKQKYKVAGLAHENEYITPSEGLENPSLRPFLSIIERQRTAGNLRTFNFAEATKRLKGYATGGATSNNITPMPQLSNVTDNQLLLATVAKLAEAVDKFPRTVKAQMSYFDDFKRVQDEVENTNNTITL